MSKHYVKKRDKKDSRWYA